MKYTLEAKKLPFHKRLQVYWEFDGYWDVFLRTLDFSWYEGGSYE